MKHQIPHAVGRGMRPPPDVFLGEQLEAARDARPILLLQTMASRGNKLLAKPGAGRTHRFLSLPETWRGAPVSPLGPRSRCSLRGSARTRSPFRLEFPR